MKIKTTGKSLKELVEIYGIGSSGFYPQEWYKEEKFYTEKPEAGEYDIDFDIKNTNQTYREQVAGLKEGYKPIHTAILCEAVLSHYKETGVKLLENKYSRTETLDSVGYRVYVGLSGARKLPLNTRDFEPVEARIKALEDWKERVINSFK